MKLHIKYCLTTICFLFLIETHSQTCSIIFETENPELAFFVTISPQINSISYRDKVHFVGLQANNKYLARIKFENDSIELHKTLFIFDAGFLHYYTVDKQGIYPKKIIPEAAFNNTDSIFTINCNKLSITTTDSIITDTTKKDTTYKVPFADYYHLEDYKGKIGCPWPINEEKIAELKNILLNESLEEIKLSKVQTAINDIDSLCFLMNQVKELTMYFEYEETKIAFTKFLSPYFFDIDNLGKLEEVFNFKNSLEELRLFIRKED